MKENQLSVRMKSFSAANKNLGDYITLSMAVRGMQYNKWDVYKAFKKYVPKPDYAESERERLMDYLVLVNNRPDSEKRGLTKPNEKMTLPSLELKS